MTTVRTFPPRSKRPITAVLSLPPVPDPAFFLAEVPVAGLAADESFVCFHFATKFAGSVLVSEHEPDAMAVPQGIRRN
jgi:hypothetical protein